jgi:long-chain acyl-CoA synthetase
MVATIAAVRTIIPNLGTGDVYLAYLPLAHVFDLAAEVILFEFQRYQL